MSAAPRERLALGVLARLPLFEGISRPHFAEVVRQARTLHYARGQTVAKRGEMVPGLFAVAYGMVKLSLHGATGAEKVLRLVGPSQTFGEIALFRREPLPLDAVAVVDTGLVMVPSATLLSLIETDAHFARSLVASLCQRLHAMVSDFEATTLHGATERLAAYLQSLAESPHTASVTLPAAKKLIAARLGMTKETFSRALRELARDGLVRVAGRTIALLDRERLARAGGGPEVDLRQTDGDTAR
ncbi:MAG: Crp/Fnr family transcriptional regulator [Betaproteobacteria bacterium]|nr:Crp/Fnr family transcriptional regulator [Betaproteobacteria bacterium]